MAKEKDAEKDEAPKPAPTGTDFNNPKDLAAYWQKRTSREKPAGK